MRGTSRILAITALTIALGGSVAEALPHRTSVERRQAMQELRIRYGRQIGKITRMEARHLRMAQRRIAAFERRKWRDGQITMRERARIQRMLDRQSRMIQRLRNNMRQVIVY